MTTSDHTAKVSYLLEHSHGVCELWLTRDESSEIPIFQPLKLLRISGEGTLLLRAEMISEAIALDEWMADHMEVFTDGRTSAD